MFAPGAELLAKEFGISNSVVASVFDGEHIHARLGMRASPLCTLVRVVRSLDIVPCLQLHIPCVHARMFRQHRHGYVPRLQVPRWLRRLSSYHRRRRNNCRRHNTISARSCHGTFLPRSRFWTMPRTHRRRFYCRICGMALDLPRACYIGACQPRHFYCSAEHLTKGCGHSMLHCPSQH
jgi:hypothetical protein